MIGVTDFTASLKRRRKEKGHPLYSLVFQITNQDLTTFSHFSFSLISLKFMFLQKFKNFECSHLMKE